MREKPYLRHFAALILLIALGAPGARLAAQAEDQEIDDGSAIDVPSSANVEKPPSSTEAPAPNQVEEAPAAPAPPAEKQISAQVPPTEKPSSESGEPIFDWSKHQGETTVPHPFAEKGLIRITKDQDYYYKVEETRQTKAATFQFGMFAPTQLQNPDEAGQPHATFADNYNSVSNPQILFTYEWQLWQSEIGKFGLQAGSGLYVAQGHGHFVGGVNANLTPLEVFTFVALPNSFGAVYRGQFWHRQLFVPYGAGGGTVWTFSEFRDDNKPPKFGGAVSAYVDAGVEINLTYFDYLSRVQLNHEYGINAVYLTLGYRQILALETRFDFTGSFINGGLLMEF